MTKLLQIAIDGPVGAGKSTVAKLLAEKLGIIYIYTGAMYRAVALYTKQKDISWTDQRAIEAVVDTIEIDLRPPKWGSKYMVRVYLFGKEVTKEVFTGELGEGASVVSQYFKVREVLVRKQRELAEGKSVVMDGRDIGTNVLPDANLKIYLDADVDERVRRKQSQLHISSAKAQQDVQTRDRREMGRDNNPLRPAKDAWVLDTTDLTIERVVEKIIDRVKSLGFQG